MRMRLASGLSCLLRAGVEKWGGWGGGCSAKVHANAACIQCFFYAPCRGGEGGRMGGDGDDDNYDDNNDNVAPCCCCFHVTSQTLPIQKSRVSWALQTKTEKPDTNVLATKTTKTTVLTMLRNKITIAKNSQQHGEAKEQNIVLFTKTTQNLRFSGL